MLGHKQTVTITQDKKLQQNTKAPAFYTTSGCWACCLHYGICYYPCHCLHCLRPLEKLLLRKSSRKLKYPAQHKGLREHVDQTAWVHKHGVYNSLFVTQPQPVSACFRSCVHTTLHLCSS